MQNLITAKTLFDDILQINDNPKLSFHERYEALYAIFLLVLKDKTKDSNITFAGPFPRMTYLCNKYKMSELIYGYINTFRVHSRENLSVDAKLLEENYKYDLKALVDFISLIYVEEPVNKLRTILHFPYKKNEGKKEVSNVIKIIVDKWDDNYIYGRSADIESDIIKVDYQTPNNHGKNFGYIKDIIKNNTQFNLIKTRKENGVYYPELIIIEPDYLIDISAIASCFTEYGNSSYNYLVNKIKPSTITSPILLGNLASQFLDEVINNKNGKDIKYSTSITKFFRDNALDIATCSDMNDNFHVNARQQLDILKNIIEIKFPELSNIEMDQIILEPSFICEMLGLQGRMDLLQKDYRILMEQKSGQREYGTGRHKEPHYVQMLLYQAVLHYGFSLKNEHISSFLLYSKYADGLIKEGPAPKLLFDALKIRNEIVAHELSYTNEKEVESIFKKLTPKFLNINEKDDKLWRNYQEPQLNSLLSEYHHATQLEKDYFCRLFAFIERENILSKIGSSTKENDGFSSVWNATLDEKKQTGDIYNNLTIIQKECTEEDSGYDLLTLQIPQQEDDFLSNFRIGDVVILYSYPSGQEPNALQTMVLRGSVKDIKNEEITIKLRAPQRNENVFNKSDKWRWAIEHDYMEASYGSLYKSIYSFFNATKERKELLLNTREPQIDTTIRLNGDYGQFNELVLKAKQAKEYFLLIGPPGTGKTSFGLVNLLKEALSEARSNILLASYTNRAVDEICSKLIKHNIPFIRIGSELSCDTAYHDCLLCNKTKACRNVNEIKEMIQQTRVVVGTTSSLTSKQNLFNIKHFNMAIVDESSQILEPQLMGLICAQHNGVNAIDKFVFIGDYKQLPAVVQQTEQESEVKEESLRKIGLTNCRNSLFERLINLQKGNQSMSYLMTRQGRMHPDVATFSNQSFYENKLLPVPIKHQEKPLQYDTFDKSNDLEKIIATKRLCFITSEGYQTTTIKVNTYEAKEIAALIHAVWKIYEKNNKPFDTKQTIGVIVPYRNQISTIRKELSKYDIEELLDITIDTVERYQGSERDIIIYGFTIHKLYQLDFLTSNTFIEDDEIIDRKLNVAMTRAREQMFLVGNPDILKANLLFSRLLDYTKSINGFVELPIIKFV